MSSAAPHHPPLGRRLRRGGSVVALAGMLALTGLFADMDPAAAQSTNGGGRGAAAGGGGTGGATGGTGAGGRSSGGNGERVPLGAVIRPDAWTQRDYIDPEFDETDRRPVRRRRRPVASVEEPRIVLPAPGDDRLVAGEVLVELRKGVRIEPIATRLRLEIVARTSLTLTGTVIHRLLGRDRASSADILRRLGGERGIAFAQPDYIHALQQDTAPTSAPPPSGTDAPTSVVSVAPVETTPALPGQYVGVKLDLAPAHARALGRGMTIGVVDTAVDQNHPDLGGVVTETLDVIGGGGEPAGHGTAMAGAIAAHGRLTGTAPGARLLVARAFGDPGAARGSQGTSFHVVGGFDWVVSKGARVVSLSFAGPRDALLGRELEAARVRGVIVVAAAGNAGPQSPPLYPAAEPSVIAVTASDGDDHVFTGANRGRHIAVTAPGVDVLVTAPHGGYDLSTGTSVAAAEVAGVVALMLEGRGTSSEAEVRRRLQTSARDLGEPGPDPVFGAGLVDAGAAVK